VRERGDALLDVEGEAEAVRHVQHGAQCYGRVVTDPRRPDENDDEDERDERGQGLQEPWGWSVLALDRHEMDSVASG
jgi:hypothetical protein